MVGAAQLTHQHAAIFGGRMQIVARVQFSGECRERVVVRVCAEVRTTGRSATPPIASRTFVSVATAAQATMAKSP